MPRWCKCFADFFFSFLSSQCFVSEADPFILAVITDDVLSVNLTEPEQLVEALFARLQRPDCLPPLNVDPTVSRHYVTILVHAFSVPI